MYLEGTGRCWPLRAERDLRAVSPAITDADGGIRPEAVVTTSYFAYVGSAFVFQTLEQIFQVPPSCFQTFKYFPFSVVLPLS